MSFEDAIKLLMVSFDSTIKANLSVGLPIDVQCYKGGSLQASEPIRVEADDPYFLSISDGWGEALRTALAQLPSYTIGEDS